MQPSKTKEELRRELRKKIREKRQGGSGGLGNLQATSKLAKEDPDTLLLSMGLDDPKLLAQAKQMLQNPVEAMKNLKSLLGTSEELTAFNKNANVNGVIDKNDQKTVNAYGNGSNKSKIQEIQGENESSDEEDLPPMSF